MCVIIVGGIIITDQEAASATAATFLPNIQRVQLLFGSGGNCGHLHALSIVGLNSGDGSSSGSSVGGGVRKLRFN